MRALIAVLAILGVVCVCPASADLPTTGGPSAGRTITVDDDGAADFSTIQAAIDDSNDGDTVLVADGTYTGHGNRDIDFHGKAITVKSENGPATCIIDCNGSEDDEHRGFYFHSREGPDSMLSGFTITNSYPGLYCRPFPPYYCAPRGGAIQCEMWYGPASPTIRNCIVRNSAAADGVGVFIGHDGGFPTLINCTISGNGGGALYAEATSGATLTDCILWGNGGGETIREEGAPVVTASYCDIEGGWSGEGNIDADPCFADPNNGDYHVKSQGGRWDANEGGWTTDEVTSPCIDAGDPMSPIGPEPFPNGGIVNMGAYGGTAEASKSYFGGPPCETIVAGDVNGDCNVNFLDFRIMALHWLEGNRPSSAVTTTYLFQSDPSALTTSGGFGGSGHGSYCVEGQFELTVDSCAGAAWFSRVDANIACGESKDTVGLDALFYMTELVSTDVNEAAIDFVFERNIPTFPGADVHLRVVFLDGSVELVGNVCDAMYDGYCYHLDAVAVPEP